jgi:hypothetical protein
VIGPCIFWVCVAGVLVISVERPDVSKSLGLSESLGRVLGHSESCGRYSRIAAESGVLHQPFDLPFDLTEGEENYRKVTVCFQQG